MSRNFWCQAGRKGCWIWFLWRKAKIAGIRDTWKNCVIWRKEPAERKNWCCPAERPKADYSESILRAIGRIQSVVLRNFYFNGVSHPAFRHEEIKVSAVSLMRKSERIVLTEKIHALLIHADAFFFGMDWKTLMQALRNGFWTGRSNSLCRPVHWWDSRLQSQPLTIHALHPQHLRPPRQ